MAERLMGPKYSGVGIDGGGVAGGIPGSMFPVLNEAEKQALVLKVPPELPRRQFKDWIDTTLALTRFPLVKTADLTREQKRLVSLDRDSAIIINTAGGLVFPRFQFDRDGRVHWIVRSSHFRLREDLARAKWWISPNSDLGDFSPAALLNTERQWDIPPVLKKIV